MPRRGPTRAVSPTDSSASEIYTLSLHDALPIWRDAIERTGLRHVRPDVGARRRGPARGNRPCRAGAGAAGGVSDLRSEEHTSELQSRRDLVCRLLLEKKKKGSVIPVASTASSDATARPHAGRFSYRFFGQRDLHSFPTRRSSDLAGRN